MFIFAPSYKGLNSHTVKDIPVYRFRYFFKRWEDLTHGEGAPNRVQSPFYFALSFIYLVSGALHAIRFCRQHQFDVIQVHWPFPHGVWGYLAGVTSGTPMTLHFHGAEVLLAKKVFFVKYFLRHAIRHASALFANSGFTRREVTLYTDRTVEVIPYGSSLDVSPEPKIYNSDYKQILFVGRLIERKGVDYLLQALSQMPTDLNWRLNVVGIGEATDTLRSLAQQLGIDQRVHFYGFIPNEELAIQYQQADVFVLPAIRDQKGDTEGLGVVMIEALTFKTPVVASDVGGISDVIIDGKTGLLVPEKDPEQLAKAINRILSDNALAKRLGEAGCEHAKSYFDWERIVDRLLEETESSLNQSTLLKRV
ncbi:MAG TPA: glycosyltransferase family 4 protein [Gammaproteobacteria bacterium]|nr:glycosyltransferase family 4 protein [Gammaproteobacteria bacterium]